MLSYAAVVQDRPTESLGRSRSNSASVFYCLFSIVCYQFPNVFRREGQGGGVQNLLRVKTHNLLGLQAK